MKIFELLTGTTQPTPNAMSPTAPMGSPAMGTSPMGTAPMAGTGTPGAPMKTAGLWDTISNFATTPQPIGGNAAPAAPTAAPGGAPAQTSSGIMPRMFGNSAVGQTLDAVNSGLQSKPIQPQQ